LVSGSEALKPKAESRKLKGNSRSQSKKNRRGLNLSEHNHQPGEFELIATYFAGLTAQAGVALGIGDDAALLDVTPHQQLVVASDTLVENIHFPAASNPQQIASRALCVNLSDMAAMGAQPRWFTLALTLPADNANPEWLADFSAGLGKVANQYGVALIGGDTTSGPLALTLTLLGEAPPGASLTRAGAKPGETVFVTGTLGDGAAALNIISNKYNNIIDSDRLLQRFYCPQPQVEAGLILRSLASACIDISDGLVADLGHICQASGVRATIETERLPIADDVQRLSAECAINWALYGGDDYQLCFTVAADKLAVVEELIEQCQLDATRIGVINTPLEDGVDSIERVTLIDKNNNFLTIEQSGYNHFGH